MNKRQKKKRYKNSMDAIHKKETAKYPEEIQKIMKLYDCDLETLQRTADRIRKILRELGEQSKMVAERLKKALDEERKE